MNTYLVKIEEIVTYEVTVEANSSAHAERTAENDPVLEELTGSTRLLSAMRSESKRALSVVDITPKHQWLANTIERLVREGYTITPPQVPVKVMKMANVNPADLVGYPEGNTDVPNTPPSVPGAGLVEK